MNQNNEFKYRDDYYENLILNSCKTMWKISNKIIFKDNYIIYLIVYILLRKYLINQTYEIWNNFTYTFL